MIETKTCMWGSTKHGQGSGVRGLSLTVPRSSCEEQWHLTGKKTGFPMAKRKMWNDKWSAWDILLHRKWGAILWMEFYKNCSESNMAGGSIKWYSHFGKLAIFFYKIRHTPMIWPSNGTPRYLPKYLFMNVYSSFIISKNWKQLKCPSFSDRIDSG